MHAAYICIDSSQDRLAHTLARLPNTRKSASDLISPILARYDLKKEKKFRMTVEPSYGREGIRFWVADEPSHRRKRVKDCFCHSTFLLLSMFISAVKVDGIEYLECMKYVCKCPYMDGRSNLLKDMIELAYNLLSSSNWI